MTNDSRRITGRITPPPPPRMIFRPIFFFGKGGTHNDKGGFGNSTSEIVP